MEDAMNSWSRLGAAVLTALLTLPLTMCGAAAPAEQAPSATPAGAPATESAPAPGQYPQGTYPSAPPEQPGYPAPSAATGGAAPDQTDLAQRRAAARAELDRAQSDLDAAATDCAAACRALSSMERATQHLCTLASDPDDQKRCDDAQHRLATARARVKSSCGTCS
jgi:hypothetical protein